MIDTNKLLSNRSGGSTTLSRKSVINIGLIREDVIKIDGLLKSRLVLSKVRDGIERQSLERLRRKSREDDLERDDDRDDNRRRDPDPKPKKGRGLIGFLIGGALAVIGGIAMKFLPIILSLGKFIGRIAKVFTFVIGGTFAAIGNFISLFNDGSKKIKGIDKDQLDEGYVNDVFTNFNGALDALVTSLIIGGAISMGIKTVMGRNAKTAIKNLKKEATPAKMKKSAKKPAPKRRGRPKKFQTLAEVQADINLREFQNLQKKFLKLKKSKAKKPKPSTTKSNFFEKMFFQNREPNKFNVREKPPTPDRDELLRQFNVEQRAIQYGKTFDQIQVSLQDVEFVGDDVFLNRKFSKTPKPALLLETVNIDGKDFYFFNETDSMRLLEERYRKRLEIKDQRRQREIKKQYQTQQQKIQQPLGKINQNNFRSAGAMGRQSYPPGFEYELIRPSIFERGRSALSQTADFLSPSNLKGLLTQRGGIVKVLSAIGGDTFVQTFKQGLKGSIGFIPILGDVFGFLLDYFVFGEPIGRAAFKAIGSFALSSLIGAVGLALGGPVGAFIGGMIGGIGGDILGGIAYDLFFGTDGGVSAKSSATKGAVKGVVTQTFEDGGYVGDEPPTTSFKPLVNSVDKSINLRTTPSYARGGGKVKFIPLPIHIPTGQSQEEEEQVSVTSNTIETKTFAGLYER